MQLDLLYKGLPSAKADTRKFRVQIHSNAISFTQHEGRGGQGGGGRKGHFPHILPPLHPPAPSDLPSITFPPFQDGKTNQKGGKKKRKRLWQGWGVPGRARQHPPSQPQHPPGSPWGSSGEQKVPKPPALACPPLPQRFQDKN